MRLLREIGLPFDSAERANRNTYSYESCDDQGDIWSALRRKQSREITFRMIFGPIAILYGAVLTYCIDDSWGRWSVRLCWLLGDLSILS